MSPSRKGSYNLEKAHVEEVLVPKDEKKEEIDMAVSIYE
jgi:hypothetical protein